MPTREPDPIDVCECWPGDSLDDWDVVDEASWESFPCSDPPAYDHPHLVCARRRAHRAAARDRQRRISR